MNAGYPNLELLEYKARVALSSDEEFLKTIEEKRKNDKYVYVEMEAIVFPQIWGSTCTGFDVSKDGSPAIGGCAMTKEYTTVFHELLTDTYIIFFGDSGMSEKEKAEFKEGVIQAIHRQEEEMNHGHKKRS